ncbi:hypothetical protein [Streptomyces sp. SAS_272]|uniref:hypothetical protein n=1 Tax=Streptomyces sp. SAS_272 TaxID=3412747 RepID=UPI00403D4A01
MGPAHGLPVLPASGCSVGGDQDTIRLMLKDTDPTRVVSKAPLIVSFAARDAQFAVPRTAGAAS